MSQQAKALERWFVESPAAVPAIFALALLLRVAVILAFPIEPISDARWYMDRAGEMAAGMGYQEAGFPTAFWPVGYPAMAALTQKVFGASLLGPILLNLLAIAATLCLILWFVRHLGGGETAARCAMLLYALYPAHVFYAGQTVSEVTATAVTMAGMALLVAGRGRFLLTAAAGVLLGIATLMRPQTILFAPGVIVLMVVALRDFDWRRAIWAAVVVNAALALTVAPWTVRNVVVMGTPALVSTNGGVALQAGANDLANGGYFQVERSPLWRDVGIDFADRVERQVEIDARLKQMAWRWIGENPVAWAQLGPRKIAALWMTDGDAFWAFDASHPDWSSWWHGVKLINQIYYLTMLLLALGATWVAMRAVWRRDLDTAPMILLAAMPIFASLLAFGFTGQTRYHYPAMPFVAMLAAWLLVRLRARVGVAAPARRRTATA